LPPASLTRLLTVILCRVMVRPRVMRSVRCTSEGDPCPRATIGGKALRPEMLSTVPQ
jgi:hypothetical protein